MNNNDDTNIFYNNCVTVPTLKLYKSSNTRNEFPGNSINEVANLF